MDFYSYKIVRDYGFAPNPFHGYCTLANCKPKIRRVAKVGDWILGTGSKEIGLLNRLIFLMKITDKLSYQEYWSSTTFQIKKPNLTGSIVQMYGDNIYHKDENDIWLQSDSHHSFENGILNEANLMRDLSGEYVLVSDHFYYFGENHIKIPKKLIPVCCKSRDYEKKTNLMLATELINWMGENYLLGIHGDPINWSGYKQLSLF